MATARRSFSLIELVIVMTIIVILSAVAAPAFIQTDKQKLERATRELEMHLEMARDLAMATGRRTWVDFSTSGNSYSVYIEHPTLPGKSNRIWVTHPVEGGNFHVDFDDGEFSGVDLYYAQFGWSSEVEFDWLGRPYNGSGWLLIFDGYVRLRAGSQSRTIGVTAVAGCIRQV